VHQTVIAHITIQKFPTHTCYPTANYG